MSCVVCERPIAAGDEHYANTWEKSRKRYTCCSEACAQKFNPDIHWIPQVFPPPADEAEQTRLLGVSRARLYQGDLATVIVHEMLLAGVSPEALRRVLLSGYIASGKAEGDARRSTLLGIVGGLFTGWYTFFKRADKRDMKSIKLALADLDRWEARRAATAPQPDRRQ